jgi:protein required for attachment to host cells
VPATWILAADSARARLFAVGTDGRLAEIFDVAHPAGRQMDRERERDARGRYFSKGRRDRAHANEPRNDPEEVEEDRFARELASELERGRVEMRYDRLCLIAPPRFLGRLRRALNREVKRLVVQSLPKDLVAHDLPALEKYVDTRRHRRELPRGAG